MRYELKRIEVGTVARISFFLSWIGGVLVGLVLLGLYRFASGFDPAGFEAQLQSEGAEVGPWVVWVGAFFISILCAFLGALLASLLAIVYNALAGVIGGVRVRLEPATSIASEPPAPQVETLRPSVGRVDHQEPESGSEDVPL
ncbi:MAG: DUF3566 domain-containing protein [Candidatus Eisenbacteria bacterium]